MIYDCWMSADCGGMSRDSSYVRRYVCACVVYPSQLAALLWSQAARHASRLHRPSELPRPREGHTAVFQRLWKTAGSRPEKWVNDEKL